MKYPLKPSDIVSQADIAAGRVNICHNYMDYVHQINAAFNTGYIMAMCDTKEEFDSITTEERILCCALAKLNAAKFYGLDEENPA